MSTVIWKGGASAVAQVDTLTVGGTILVTDQFKMTIGSKTLTVVAGSTTADTVATSIATAWNALSSSLYPEFSEITAAATTGGALTLTADTAGKPFTVSVSVTGTGTLGQSHTTVNSGPNDVGIATNYAGGALPITGDTLLIDNTSKSLLYNLESLAAVALASLQITQSFTGTIGLPVLSGSGNSSYVEYRPRYFKIGASSCTIGQGNGVGSGRIMLNFSTMVTTCQVLNCGRALETGVPAILLLGTHATNALTVLRGTVGVAYFAGESSTISTLNVGYVTNIKSDANVSCGSGTTLTTVKQVGGILDVQSSITTLTQSAGTLTMFGSGTITTGTVRGTLTDGSSGTITALTVQGVYDHSKSMTAKTITTLTMLDGSEYHDPFDVVTLTNGIALYQTVPVKTSAGGVLLDIGPNHTLTVT